MKRLSAFACSDAGKQQYVKLNEDPAPMRSAMATFAIARTLQVTLQSPVYVSSAVPDIYIYRACKVVDDVNTCLSRNSRDEHDVERLASADIKSKHDSCVYLNHRAAQTLWNNTACFVPFSREVFQDGSRHMWSAFAAARLQGIVPAGRIGQVGPSSGRILSPGARAAGDPVRQPITFRRIRLRKCGITHL
jgi:hypothetical protein